MVQKAKTPTTAADKIRGLNNHKSTLYGIGRFKSSPVTSGSGSLGNLGGSAGGSTSAAGNYVSRGGDTMHGPLAFHPKLTAIENGQINISDTSGNYSSNVIVSAETGLTDTLLTITGAAFAGQLLFLQGVSTATLTLKDSLSSGTAWVTSTSYSLGDIVANGGNLYSCKLAHMSAATTEPGVGATWETAWYKANIETIDGTDFSLEDDDNIIFKFDSTDNKWQQVTIGKQGGAGGGGVTLPIEPTVTDNSDTWTGTQTLNLDTGDGHVYKWTVDQDLTFAASVTNPPTTGTQRTFELEFDHDEVGGTFTVTLPNNFIDEKGNAIASFTLSTGKALLSVRINNGTDFLVFRKNVTTVSLAGASKALDNLVSPILNVGIDFNSKSPINFPGFTTPIIGQAFAVGAGGFEQSLQSGAAYLWNINGVAIASLTSVGLAMSGVAGAGNITLGENFMTIDDISTPANPGTGARRLFVSDVSGELSVRTAAGTTVSLESAAGDLWSDPVDADIVPGTDLIRTLGSATKQFVALYTPLIRFDTSTVFIKKDTGTGNLQLNASSGDQIDFILSGTTEWFISSSKLDGSSNTLRCGLIEFSTSVNHSIQASGAGIQYNVPTSDIHDWKITGASEMKLSASSLDIQGNDLVFDTNQEITTDGGGLTYKVPTGTTHEFQVNTNAIIALSSSQLLIADGIDISVGTTTGTKIGTSGTAKLGAYGATPIIRPTGVAVTASGIHAALVSLGWITA